MTTRLKLRTKKQKSKKKIDLSRSWVTWTTVGHGIQIYALFTPAYPCPLGLAWGIGQGASRKRKDGLNGQFEVFGSFTSYFARRNGVRTRINDEILKQYCAVTSGTSQENDSGKKFMQATGYEYDKRIDAWIKVPNQKSKRPA